MDSDFYLADLLSSENQSLLDKLFVVLQKTHYEFNKTITFMGTEQKNTATFKDNQKKRTLPFGISMSDHQSKNIGIISLIGAICLSLAIYASAKARFLPRRFGHKRHKIILLKLWVKIGRANITCGIVRQAQGIF